MLVKATRPVASAGPVRETPELLNEKEMAWQARVIEPQMRIHRLETTPDPSIAATMIFASMADSTQTHYRRPDLPLFSLTVTATVAC